ncbi:MAG: O-antigen ligase family protein [Phycisphaerales bacterium]|nr:O-antigen ligase family protein [Phycisphaerales bacterium]
MVATVAILLQPIANAPANVGFVLLCIMGALRVHRLWRAWALMFREWFWLLLVAWAAWTGITLLWSEAPEYGLRQWSAFRAILWVPLLWPVMDRWRWMVFGLLAGVACGNALQLSQYWWGWPKVRADKGIGGGLHMYTYMGAWCAIAFAIWMMMAVSLPWRRATIAVALASLAAIGLVIASTRGVVIGAALEVLVVAAVLAIRQRDWMRRAVVRASVGTAILCIVWMFVGERVERRFEAMMVEVRVVASPAPLSAAKSTSAADQADAGDASATATQRASIPSAPISEMALRARLADSRFHVWDYSLLQWRESPVVGIGFGSVLPRAKHASEHDTMLTSEQRKGVSIGHPHSTWIQTLSETGLVGFSLYASWVLVILACAWSALAPQTCFTAGHITRQDGTRHAPGGTREHRAPIERADPLTGPVPSWLDAGLLGAVIAFLVAAQFDCYQMNATAFAIGLIPAAILCRPRGAAQATAPRR